MLKSAKASFIVGDNDQNKNTECRFCQNLDIFSLFAVVKLLIYDNLRDIIRSIFYAVDVGSDIGSGISFYRGEPLNSSRPSCENQQQYSHLTWGTLIILLTWAPALPLMVSWLLAVVEYPIFRSRISVISRGDLASVTSKIKLKKERIALESIVFPIWPIVGFFL